MYSFKKEKDNIYLIKDSKKVALLDRVEENINLENIEFKNIRLTKYDVSKNCSCRYKDNILYFDFNGVITTFNFDNLNILDQLGEVVNKDSLCGNIKNIKTLDNGSQIFIEYVIKHINKGYLIPSVKTILKNIRKSNIEDIKKMIQLGFYVKPYILYSLNIDDVAKDIRKLLIQYKNDKDDFIKNNCVLSTLKYSKKYHESYKNNFIEKNKLYFEILNNNEEKYYELINVFNYNEETLIKYIDNIKNKQNYNSISSLITDLYDYANMHNLMELDINTKYPKYLKSMHDEMVVKFSSFKQNYGLDLSKIYNNEYNYRKEDKNMYVLEPKNTLDIIDDALKLKHCAASYIDNILKEKTKLVFLRKINYTYKEIPNLLTLEIKNNALVQARGICNRFPTVEEINFLKDFCLDKKLEFKI